MILLGEAELLAADDGQSHYHECSGLRACDCLDGALSELGAKDSLAGIRGSRSWAEILGLALGPAGNLSGGHGLNDRAFIDPVCKRIQRGGGRTTTLASATLGLLDQRLVRIDFIGEAVAAAVVA